MTDNDNNNIKQKFKDRNHFYIRIGERFVVPLLLILHDHNKFTEIQFHELITVIQGIIKNHFKGGTGIYSTFIPLEQATSSKPLYLSDLGFTFRFAPTYPKYSIFIKNPNHVLGNNQSIQVKRKETIYIDKDDEKDDNDKDKDASKDDNKKEEENEEIDITDEDVSYKKKRKKKKVIATTTTTTTTINSNAIGKINDSLEIIETRFDKQQVEEEVDIDILNDRAIAAVIQEDYNNGSGGKSSEPIEIKDDDDDNKQEEEVQSSQEQVYSGGIYKGLQVTGHTLVVETHVKINVSNALPLKLLHNSSEFESEDDFNLPDQESDNSSSKSKSKSSSKKSTYVKKKSNNSSKRSKSTIIATNNNDFLSLKVFNLI